MHYFDHERLPAYVCAMEFVGVVDEVVEHFPNGRGDLVEMLQKGAMGVLVNIAEGGSEEGERVRFYRLAKRAVVECAAVLEVGKQLNLVKEARYIRGRELLIKIATMLGKMMEEENIVAVIRG